MKKWYQKKWLKILGLSIFSKFLLFHPVNAGSSKLVSKISDFNEVKPNMEYIARSDNTSVTNYNKYFLRPKELEYFNCKETD